MIRHIYDPDDTGYSSSAPSHMMFQVSLSAPPEMMSQVNVFAAADKYDVPSLRVLVMSNFTQSMEHKWQTNPQEFCTVIQRLCGPTAVRFADASLQISAASFCSDHIRDLVKNDAFVNMLEEGEPFAGRLLTAVIKGTADKVIQTFRCQQCKSASDDSIKKNLSVKCINCSSSGNSGYGGSSRLVHYRDFRPQ